MNGQIWKRYLNNPNKDNIMLYVNRDTDNLIICQALEYHNYTSFTSHSFFNKYIVDNKIPENKMCFFECIMDYQNKKPYFDIDIESNEFDTIPLIEELKNNINFILNKYEYSILVYTSHTKEKKSFHIIINGVYFSKKEELISFFDKIIERTSEKYIKYFDKSVYSNTQLFRMLGSKKYNKNNTKIFCKELSQNYFIPDRYKKNKKGLNNYNLGISLVTNTTGCCMITDFINKVSGYKKIDYNDYTSINIDVVENILHKKYPNFEIDKILDGIITLRTTEKYYCDICKRSHDSENPYIIVKNITKSVVLVCRRQQDEHGIIKPLLLGTLEDECINLKYTNKKKVYSPKKYEEILNTSKIEDMRMIKKVEKNSFNLKEFSNDFKIN